MIFFVLILALGLRIIGINQSFWLDEASQAIISSKGLASVWFERGGDFHPPLSYIFSSIWLMISRNDIWLRLLPILFGVGSVYLLFLLTKQIFNEKVGIIAAILLSIAPYHIYYSQEFRMYSQATFFAILTIFTFWKLIERDNFRNILYFSLAGAGLIYTHYFGFFLLASLTLYMIFYQKTHIGNFLKALLIILVLFLPWFPQFLNQLKNGVSAEQYLPGWGSVLSESFIDAIPLTFFKFIVGRIDFKNEPLHLFFYLLIASVLVFPLIHSFKKIREKEVSLMWFWLFGPIFMSLVISFFVPIYQPFRLLFILPAFVGLIAYGLEGLKNRNIFFALIILISFSGFFIFNTNEKFWREDWRGATNFINQNVKNGDLVLFVWPEQFPPYEWYGGSSKNLFIFSEKFPVSESEINKRLTYATNAEILYVFEYLQDLTDPSRTTQASIEKKGYRQIEKKDFRGVGYIDIYKR